MTVAICDDERTLCEQIEKLVKKEVRNCCIRRFASGEELLAAAEVKRRKGREEETFFNRK